MFDSEKIEEIVDFVTQKIYLANRTGDLETLLTAWGLQGLVQDETKSSNDFYDTDKNGKIVVIGASQVKERDLTGVAKSLGIDKDSFEVCIDYKETKSFKFSELRYNPKYRLIIVGPMPHSTEGKGESSSVIAEMENADGYPKVIRLGSNELKITKTNFRNALQEMQRIDYI